MWDRPGSSSGSLTDISVILMSLSGRSCGGLHTQRRAAGERSQLTCNHEIFLTGPELVSDFVFSVEFE